MFGLLKKLFIAIGKASEEANDTYEPQYNGRWKNRAGGNKEDWVWIEKAEKSVVNVFQIEDDYILAVGTKPRPSAIETVECVDKRDQEIALELLALYYGTLGNVVQIQQSSDVFSTSD